MKKIFFIGMIVLSLFLISCVREADESAFAGKATARGALVSSGNCLTDCNAKCKVGAGNPASCYNSCKQKCPSPSLPSVDLVRNGEFDKSLTQGASWEVVKGDLDYMDAEVLKGYTGYSTYYYPETTTTDTNYVKKVTPASGLANGFVSRVDSGDGALDIIGKAVMLQRIPVTNSEYTVSWDGGGALEGTFVGIIEKDEQGNSLLLQSTDFLGCSGNIDKIDLYEQTQNIYKCSIDTTIGKTVIQQLKFTPQPNAKMVWLVVGSIEAADGMYADILSKISFVGPTPTLSLPDTKIKAYIRRGNIGQLEEASSAADLINYPVYELFVDAQSSAPIQRIALYNTNGRKTFYYDCPSKTKTCFVKKLWPSFFLGDKTKEMWNSLKLLKGDNQQDYKTYTLESFGEICLANTCTSDQLKVELLFMNGARETITLNQVNNFYFEGVAQTDSSQKSQPYELTKSVDHEAGWTGSFSDGCSCSSSSFKAAPVQEVKQAVVEQSTATKDCPQVSCPSCPVYQPLIKVTGSNKAECSCVK